MRTTTNLKEKEKERSVEELFNQRKYAEAIELAESIKNPSRKTISLISKGYGKLGNYTKELEVLNSINCEGDEIAFFNVTCDKAHVFIRLSEQEKKPEYLDLAWQELSRIINKNNNNNNQRLQLLITNYYLTKKEYNNVLSFVTESFNIANNPQIKCFTVRNFSQQMWSSYLFASDRLKKEAEAEKAANELFNIALNCNDKTTRLKILSSIAHSKSKLKHSTEFKKLAQEEEADIGKPEEEQDTALRVRRAGFLEKEGKIDEAIEELQNVINLRERELPKAAWPDICQACLNLAFILQQDHLRKSDEESIKYLEIIIEIKSSGKLVTERQLLNTYHSLSIAHQRLNNREAADKYTKAPLDLKEDAHVLSTKAKGMDRFSRKMRSNDKKYDLYQKANQLDPVRFKENHPLPVNATPLVQMTPRADDEVQPTKNNFPNLMEEEVKEENKEGKKFKFKRMKRSKPISLQAWMETEEQEKNKLTAKQDSEKKRPKGKTEVEVVEPQQEKEVLAHNPDQIIANQQLVEQDKEIVNIQEEIKREITEEKEVASFSIDKEDGDNHASAKKEELLSQEPSAIEQEPKAPAPIKPPSTQAKVSSNRACFFASAVAVTVCSFAVGTALYARWMTK